MADRRGLTRQKSFLRGYVYVSKKRGALACLVRDFSDKGARIAFSDNVTLPDVIDLYVPKKNRSVRARLQWRRNGEIGLAFVAADQAPLGAEPTAVEVIQRMALLEAEIATLRDVLKRLQSAKSRERNHAAA